MLELVNEMENGLYPLLYRSLTPSVYHVYLHPDDFQYVMRRLLDPDDAFSEVDYMSLYREAVTVGTARPFRQLWAWPAPPSSVGDSCGASSRSGASRRHSPR